MKKILLLALLLMFSCKNNDTVPPTHQSLLADATANTREADTIEKYYLEDYKEFTADIDGDKLLDTVYMVRSTINKKYGLKISYGNKEIDYIGMGTETSGLGLANLNWVGVMERVDKGRTVWTNLDDNGEFRTDEDTVRENEKVYLHNDAIYLHAAESCGGGILYRNGEEYAWVVQE